MDNSADSSTRAWATPMPAVAALLVGGAALLLCAILVSTDAAGRTIMAIAGAMLLGFGAYAALIRPRLSVTSGPSPTLTIRRIGGEITLTPAEVERIRILSMRRIGRRSGQLEIDYGPADSEPKLIVFSRWDLGADLLDVVDALADAGYPVEDSPR
ncbi:PH domain-containing protein [Gordonia sp. VNQ95]|uniref:PH domain-containing protein n=1 Tax=Gordonia TaxID=2053 RepID=UPI0032B45A2B